MNVSFHTLWEQIQSHSPDEFQPLSASSANVSKAAQVIRTGLNLRGEDGSKTFWDDFVQVCNDTDGLAELLEVHPEQVAKWGSRVRDMIEKVNKEDDNSNTEKHVMPTGVKPNF